MKKIVIKPNILNRSNKLRVNIRRPIISVFVALIPLLLAIVGLTACKSKPEEPLPIVVEENTSDSDSPIQGMVDNITEPLPEPVTPEPLPSLPPAEEEVIAEEVFSFIDPSGTNLETRIRPPKGYVRIPSDQKELTGFIRSYPLKPDGSEVLLYDGTPKSNQHAHVAVFDLDTGDRDLQQCADSILRVYAEYFWSIGDYDRIAFHLTNGFLMEYTKWRDGNRIVVDGNNVKWSKSKSYNDSYEEFVRYLMSVFTYAGTLSLSQECKPIDISELRPGDMFLQGGSPGHCVLIVDIAEDSDGNRAFLLAQSYMPAQEFHILKNPQHPEDPWYYVSEITYPFQTPAWTFDEGSLVRWGDFPLNGAMIDSIE